MKMGSIYAAHGAFTAARTPPMIIALLLGAFWKRYTPMAAFLTLMLGTAMMFVSVWVPQLVEPFSHGIPAVGGFKFIRALYGLIICGGIAVFVTIFTKPKAMSEISGLVINSIEEAKFRFKGSAPTDDRIGKPIKGSLKPMEGEFKENSISLNVQDMNQLMAAPGDMLFVADGRWWLGCLRSAHVKVVEPHKDGPGVIMVDKNAIELGSLLMERSVKVEKIM
jgi:hypothetical protein